MQGDTISSYSIVSEYQIAMKGRHSLSWFFLLLSGGSCCWARSPSPRTIGRPRSSGLSLKAGAIPRGGGGGGISSGSLSLAVAWDPKTIATAGLCCMVGHCLVDVVKPSKVVQLYGLDASEEINSFYISRIGGWGLASVGLLLLQLYTTIPFTHALGYSFVPIAALTLYQLVTEQYDKAGVNRNSGIATLFFQAIHFFITFLDTKRSDSVLLNWIKVYMSLLGLSGLNLIISAQTVPGIGPSTVAILRMLGTVTGYASTTILSQTLLGFSPLKSIGVLMSTLAITSIPVCLDLRHVLLKKQQGNTTNVSPSTSFSPVDLYAVYILLSLVTTAVMFR